MAVKAQKLRWEFMATSLYVQSDAKCDVAASNLLGVLMKARAEAQQDLLGENATTAEAWTQGPSSQRTWPLRD
jgi:hypothetical protein